MKKYRQALVTTLILLFADVAAEPLKPVLQPMISNKTPAAAEL